MKKYSIVRLVYAARCILLAICGCSSILIGIAGAQNLRLGQRNVVVDTLRDTVFPQIVAGGSWTTTITLVNLDVKPSRVTLMFGVSEGGDLFLNFVGVAQPPRSTLSYEIPVNGCVTIQTVDTGSLQQGYGLLLAASPFGNGGKVGGVAVFRQMVPGQPEFEAAVPLSALTEKRFRIPFDNMDGFSTGIALMTFGADSQGEVIRTPTTVQAEFWDEGGVRLGTGSLALPFVAHRAFSLADQFPALANKRGSIEFRSSKDFMAGLGLRFGPGGAFTSFPTLSLPSWSPYGQ